MLSLVQSNLSQRFSLTDLRFQPQLKAARLFLVRSPPYLHVTQKLKLLRATLLSQSVIIASLHYVYRHNSGTIAHRGQVSCRCFRRRRFHDGEQFVDERVELWYACHNSATGSHCGNTYTNKTWSKVFGIELNGINEMKREFLAGIEVFLSFPTNHR